MMVLISLKFLLSSLRCTMYLTPPASCEAVHFNLQELPTDELAEKSVSLIGTIPIVAITHPPVAFKTVEAYINGVLQGTQVKASPVPPSPRVPDISADVITVKGVPP